MKLIFAGTPEFAAASLDALLAAGHEVVLVLTQPDRPAGRGMKMQSSPVKQRAEQAGIPVYQPEKLRTPESWEAIRAAGADLMVVVAYGIILPQGVLDLPRLGCINVHASLLPRWRGAAPIHRAIEAGDTETGVCIMQMDAGLDTGAVLSRATLPIEAVSTTGYLHDALAVLGAKLLCETLSRACPSAVPQSREGVTYAQKISKAESRLDWQQSAVTLDRKIRAFNPFPGAYFMLDGLPVKVWEATVLPHSPVIGALPGTLLEVGAKGFSVACGEGALQLTRIQPAGGRKMSVAEYLVGHGLVVGSLLE